MRRELGKAGVLVWMLSVRFQKILFPGPFVSDIGIQEKEWWKEEESWD